MVWLSLFRFNFPEHTYDCYLNRNQIGYDTVIWMPSLSKLKSLTKQKTYMHYIPNKMNRSFQLFNATFSIVEHFQCAVVLSSLSKFLFTIYHNPVLIKSWSVCHYVSSVVLSFHLLRCFVVLFFPLQRSVCFLFLFSMHRYSIEFMRQHWHFDVLAFIWISAVSKIDSTIISEVLKYQIDWKIR